MPKEKLDVYEMAETLGIKKENVEYGMKSDPKNTENAIQNAYDFKIKKGRK